MLQGKDQVRKDAVTALSPHTCFVPRVPPDLVVFAIALMRSPEYKIYLHVDHFFGPIWAAFPAWQYGGYYFRIGSRGSKTHSDKFSLDFKKDGNITKGVTWEVSCKDCHLNYELDLHTMTRASQINPYAEMWNSGDLTLDVALHLKAELQAKFDTDALTILSKDRACVTPLCWGAQLAGVEVSVGAQVKFNSSAQADFTGKVALYYDRDVTVKQQFWTHYKAPADVNKWIADPKWTDNSKKGDRKGFNLEVSIDASAKLSIIPEFYIGLWAGAGDWAKAHAFASVKLQLDPGMQFSLKYATDNEIFNEAMTTGQCPALDFSFSDEKFPEPEATCCGDSLPYCMDDCKEKNRVKLDFNVAAAIWLGVKLHASADFGFWNKAVDFKRYFTKSAVVQDAKPIITLVFYLASLCWRPIKALEL